MRVALVFGGNFAESDVSRSSAKNIRDVLQDLGHSIIDIEFDNNIVQNLTNLKDELDIVFNAMHGKFGEDGRLPALLDILKIPYTHSGVLPSAIAFNKTLAKEMFRLYGINTPQAVIVTKEQLKSGQWRTMVQNHNYLQNCKEFFCKPTHDGSSRDVFLVSDFNAIDFTNYDFITESQNFLIEERIYGKEINVAVVNNKAIGMMQVKPKIDDFYSYEAKYQDGASEHVEVDLNYETKKQMLQIANSVHNNFCLRTISRSEFIVTADNRIYMLEVNSHPGFTRTSLVPEIAAKESISYHDIVNNLIKDAKYDL
jgi:D-alanine-D-alanine ligase